MSTPPEPDPAVGVGGDCAEDGHRIPRPPATASPASISMWT
ncbi:hypothetical protein EBESD8_49240 [Rhodococcus aetherivorans]|nr:hypothetical protein EBESD8_49240 [Rhodococcus aetherivorans]